MAWFKALDRIVQSNGVSSVSITEATDKGLDAKQHTVIPHSCRRETVLSNMITLATYDARGNETKAEAVINAGDFKADDAAKLIIVRKIRGRVRYRYDGEYFTKITQKPIDDNQIALFVNANAPMVDTELKSKEPVYAGVMWAVLLHIWIEGIIDADDTAEVIYLGNDTVAGTLDAKAIAAITDEAQKYYPFAKLLVAAASLNHYKMNHTTGTEGVQGFLEKVINASPVLGKPPSGDRTASTKWWREMADYLYLVLHRVGKRNGAFSLLEQSPSLHGVFHPYQSMPVVFKKDEFVALRAAGLPAGAAKIGVLCAAVKMMASTGMLAFVPLSDEIKTLKVDKENVLHDPIAYHAGAAWYLKYYHSSSVSVYNQNNETNTKLTKVAAVFLQHIAPKSTLAHAPQFRNLYDTAAAEFASFDTACKAYAAARDKAVDSSKVNALIAARTNSVQIAAADAALTVLLDDKQKANHAQAAYDFSAVMDELVRDL